MGKTHYRPNIMPAQFQQNCSHKQQKTQYFYEKQHASRHIKDIPFNITKFAEEHIKPDQSGGKYTTGKAAGSILIALMMWSAAAQLASANEHKETKSYKTSHSVYKPAEKFSGESLETKTVDFKQGKNSSCALTAGHEDVKPSKVVDIKPIFKFSSGEKYFPVDPLGDDKSVANNRENYDANPGMFGSKPSITFGAFEMPNICKTEIWIMYYANNPSIFDPHEHDLEWGLLHYPHYPSLNGLKLALSHHVGFKFYENPPINNGYLEILVGKGGHPMALAKDEFIWPDPGYQEGGTNLAFDDFNPDFKFGWDLLPNESPGADNTDNLGRYMSGPTDHSFGDLAMRGDEGLFKLIGLLGAEKEQIARERAKVTAGHPYYGPSSPYVFLYQQKLEIKELYAKVKISGDAKFRVEDTILNKYTGERSPAVEELPLSHFESSGDTKGIAQQVISTFSNNRYAVEALKDTKYAITIDAVVGSQINALSASEIEIKAGQVHYISADDFSKSDSLKIGVDTNKDGTPDYSYDVGPGQQNQNGSNYIIPVAIGTGTAIGVAAYLFYRRRGGKPAMYDTKPHMQKPKAQKGMS